MKNIFFSGVVYLFLLSSCSENGNLPAGAKISAIITDPQSLAAGDTIGGFIVDEIVHYNENDTLWNGHIYFAGEIEISGIYGPHPAYPEQGFISIIPDEKSNRLLPRYFKDERNGWFLLSSENEKNLEPFISTIKGKATIRIKNFFYIYQPSDVENGADLVDIIKFEPL